MKFLHRGKLHHENSRRGGMLILVLMIFAVSLILISSAMTITLASRNRYYVDAERSQERLTLSCAAETIIDAIETQEITDAQLKTMAASNGTTNYMITGASASRLGSNPSSTDGTSIAPGLKATANQNETYFTVKPASEGSKDVILEFATIIDITGDDSKYERLRVYLEYSDNGGDPEICANMVTAGDDDDPSTLDIADLMVNTDKSYTVFHGNISMSGWSSQSYVENTAVFTGSVSAAQGSRFMHDVVFYGPNATIDCTGSGGNGISTTGNIYFIGVEYGGETGKLNVFTGSPPNNILLADGIYFYNANMTVSDAVKGSTSTKYEANVGGYFAGYNRFVYDGKYWVVDGNSTVKRTQQNTGAANTVMVQNGTFTFNAAPYETGTVTYKPASNVNSSSDQAAKDAYSLLLTQGTKYQTDEALKKAATQNVPSVTDQAKTFGAYATKAATGTISSNCGTVTLNGDKHYIMSGTYSNGDVTITGDASIYMKNDVTLDGFRIRVSNAGSDKLTIVLGSGVKLTLHGNKTGIISCDSRHGSLDGTATEVDMRATSGQKPACILAGLGANTVVLRHPAVLDAYVSLAGTLQNAGTFQFGGGSPQCPVAFYGRVEAAKIKNGAEGQGGQMFMEYCPGINDDSSAPKPLKTSYSAKSYEYFYKNA